MRERGGGGREGGREWYEEGKRKKGGWKEERDREGEGGMERETDLCTCMIKFPFILQPFC